MSNENNETAEKVAAAAAVVASVTIQRRATDPVHCTVYPNLQHAVSTQAIAYPLDAVEAVVSKDVKKRRVSSGAEDACEGIVHVRHPKGEIGLHCCEARSSMLTDPWPLQRLLQVKVHDDSEALGDGNGGGDERAEGGLLRMVGCLNHQ